MTDHSRPALSGELLTPEQEKLVRALDAAKRQGINAQVAARISRSVFFNKITEKRIQAGQAVVRAEREFMGELIEHQRTQARLFDLATEIETENLERRNRLAAAQRQAAVTELDAELALEQRRQALAQLKRSAEGTSENSRQQRNDRQYQEAQQQVEHDIRMKTLEAGKRLEMTRALRQERDRMIAEITAERRGKPTPDQEKDIDNIHDFFQRLIDEI
jgi:hypothetical protein